MKLRPSWTSLRMRSMVLPSFSTRSHLFTTMMLAFPASWARPATFVSCSVTPSVASIRIRHTSERSMAIVARRTLYFSMASSTLLLRRRPAVSMKTNLPLSFSNRESMASRVVPAMSETITRSSPRILFTREDFPALGFPITATLMASSSSSSPSSGGKYWRQASSRSPVPCPWTAETAMGSPSPRL